MDWWGVYSVPVVGSGQQPQYTTLQAASKSAAGTAGAGALGVPATAVVVLGPYSSKANATKALSVVPGGLKAIEDIPGAAVGAAASGTHRAVNSVLGNLSYSLDAQHIAGWFFRGLKILFGGILMVIGISHLTGVDNKVVQLAGKALPALALA